MSLRRDAVIDLVDRITDWVQEQAQDICCDCPYNQPESDIGYSKCDDADFDMFECPYADGDLKQMIEKFADELYCAMPTPPDELF